MANRVLGVVVDSGRVNTDLQSLFERSSPPENVAEVDAQILHHRTGTLLSK
jgi:hypothetical protein